MLFMIKSTTYCLVDLLSVSLNLCRSVNRRINVIMVSVMADAITTTLQDPFPPEMSKWRNTQTKNQHLFEQAKQDGQTITEIRCLEHIPYTRYNPVLVERIKIRGYSQIRFPCCLQYNTGNMMKPIEAGLHTIAIGPRTKGSTRFD